MTCVERATREELSFRGARDIMDAALTGKFLIQEGVLSGGSILQAFNRY